MDVHKGSITLAVLPAAAKNPTRLERLPNDLPKLKWFLDRFARDGELTPVRIPTEAEERIRDVSLRILAMSKSVEEWSEGRVTL